MADPDPDEQPLGEIGRELRVLGCELPGLVGPDVDDPGRDEDPFGRLEQRAYAREPRRAAQPEGPVPELLDERGRLREALLADRACARPAAELPGVHADSLRPPMSFRGARSRRVQRETTTRR